MDTNIDTLTIEIGASSDAAVAQIQNAVSALRAMRSELNKRWNNPLKNISGGSGASDRIRRTTTAMSSLREKIKLRIDASDADKAKKKVSGLATLFNSLKRIAFYRAIRTAIKEIAKAIEEGAENAYFFAKKFGDSTKYIANALDNISTRSFTMKNQLGAAWATLLATLEPIITKIITMIQRAVEVVTQLFALLGGKSTYLKAVDYAKAYADAAGAGAEKTKEWKNQLMSFDEINRLDEVPENDSGGGGKDALDYGKMFEEAPITILDGLKNKLKELLYDPEILNSWKTGIDGLVDSFRTAVDKIKALLKTIGTDFVFVMNDGNLAETLDHIFGILRNILDIIGLIADKFREAWSQNEAGRKILEGLWDIWNIILDTIHKALDLTKQWVSGINFTPVIDAAGKLVDAFKYFAQVCEKYFLWGLENVFLPFGKWIIEVGIPKVMDLATAFLNLYSAIYDKLFPVWKWFWEQLLIPFGQWVGEVFVNAVSKLTTTFNSLTKKIQEANSIHDFVMSLTNDEATVVAFAIAIASVGTAFLVWELAKGASKVLTTAIRAITSPVGTAIIAIAALAWGLMYLYQKCDTAREKIDLLIEKIKNFDIAQFRINIKDILFNWNNLNAETILLKLIAAFNIVLGAATGFMLGGVPGAIIGVLAGITLTGIFSTIKFKNNGEISKDELAALLKPALFALTGGIIGSVAGVKGALLGASVGLSLEMLIDSLDIRKKGKSEKFLDDLSNVLGGFVGASIIFKATGSLTGAVLGATIGFGITFALQNILFQDKSKWTPEKWITEIIAAISPTVGELIGFSVGGPLGAAIGATIGFGITWLLTTQPKIDGEKVADQYFGGLEEQSNSWVTKIKTKYYLFLADVSTWVQNAKNTFNKMKDPAFWSELGSDVVAKLAEVFVNIQNKIKEFVTVTIPNKFEELKRNIKSNFLLIKADVSSDWESFVLKVKQKFEDFKTSIAEKIDAIKESIKQKIDDVKSSIGLKIEGIRETIRTKIEEIREKIASWFKFSEKNKKDLSDNGEEATTSWKDGVTKFFADAAGVLDWIKTKIFNPFINAFKSAFGIGSPADTMKPFGENIWEGVQEGINNKLSTIGTWVINNIWTPFKDGLSSVFGKDSVFISAIGTFGGNVVTGIKNGITMGLTGFGNWIVENIWNPVADAFNQITEKIGEWWRGVQSFFSNANSQIEQAMGSTTHISENPSGQRMGGSGGGYAAGGFPEDGIFFANHGELVGKFLNGKTAVANNEQIVAGIAAGVYDAVVSAMSVSNGGRSDQPVNIYLDGKVIAQSTTRYQRQFARAAG